MKNENGFPISAACYGERCTMCWAAAKNEVPATHKVGEEILHDDPRFNQPTHNMTAYICCYDYKTIFNLKGCCHDGSN